MSPLMILQTIIFLLILSNIVKGQNQPSTSNIGIENQKSGGGQTGSQSCNLSPPCETGYFKDQQGCCISCGDNCDQCRTSNNCITCQSSYFLTPTKQCKFIECGDNIHVNTSEECDDGNQIQQDGCSKSCKVQDNFQCFSANDNNSISQCRYNSTILVSFISATKDPSSNFMVMTLATNVTLPFMNNLDYSLIIYLGFPLYDATFTYYHNGTIIVQVNYTQSLRMRQQPYHLHFDFSRSQSQVLTNMNLTQTPYYLFPTGNLAINFYSPQTYAQIQNIQKIAFILSISSLVVFGLSLLRGKMVGIQLTGMLQLSYCGLILIKLSDPLFYKISSLSYINGYNLKPSYEPNDMPPNIEYLKIYPQLIFNFNIMLGIPVIMCIISAIVVIVQKTCQRSSFTHSNLGDYSKLFIEYFYIFLVFCAYPMSFYSGVMIKNLPDKGLYFYISIGAAAVYFLVLLAVTIIYTKLNEDYFGQLKLFFRTQPKFYQQYYFSFHVIQRVLIGITLGAFESHYYSGIVALVVLLAHCIFIAVFKPFALSMQNYRSIFVMSITILNIGVYLYVTISGPYATNMFRIYSPFVVLGMIGLCIAVSFIFLCVHIKNFISIRFTLLAPPKIQIQDNIQEQNQNKIFQQQVQKRIERGSRSQIDFSKFVQRRTYRKSFMLNRIAIPGAQNNGVAEDRLLERIVNFKKYEEEWLKGQQDRKRYQIQITENSPCDDIENKLPIDNQPILSEFQLEKQEQGLCNNDSI